MKKILYMTLLTLFFAGCDDHLEELNTDKRNPASADPETLFTGGLRETFDMMTTVNVNEGVFNLFAQYWAQTTYPDESQYNLTGRTITENFWINGYRDALIDFKEAKRLIREEMAAGTSAVSNAQLQNRIAAIDIMSAYVYSILVDTFGDIPYTEALDPDNINPKYEDARTVYNSLLDSIDAATASITDAGGFSATQDPMYDGDMSQWLKFANSLKLRMGMRLADVDKAASAAIVNEALAAGVFTSNEDNASFPYLGSSPNTNPIHAALVLSGRDDFVAANTVVDVMNNLNDPRRQVYFRENLGPGVYDGAIYGTANTYVSFTQIGDLFHNPDVPGTILSYSEVQFLLAEAAARGGYNVTGSVADYYKAAIKASFDQWGVSKTEYDSYIKQSQVAYASAAGDWRQKIGIQKWLSLWVRGFEGWTTWRIMDFSGFNAPPDMKLSDIPLRFNYPLSEAQLNGEMYDAASKAIGGDQVSTQIFWDTK